MANPDMTFSKIHYPNSARRGRGNRPYFLDYYKVRIHYPNSARRGRAKRPDLLDYHKVQIHYPNSV